MIAREMTDGFEAGIRGTGRDAWLLLYLVPTTRNFLSGHSNKMAPPECSGAKSREVASPWGRGETIGDLMPTMGAELPHHT